MTRLLLALSVVAMIVAGSSQAADGPIAGADGCAALWGYAQENCSVLTGGRGW